MEYPGATLFLNVLNIWTWLIASKNLIINVMLCLAQGLANDYAPWSPLKTSVSILFLWFSWHWSAVPRTTVASLILFSPRIWRDILIVSFDIYSECIINELVLPKCVWQCLESLSDSWPLNWPSFQSKLCVEHDLFLAGAQIAICRIDSLST